MNEIYIVCFVHYLHWTCVLLLVIIKNKRNFCSFTLINGFLIIHYIINCSNGKNKLCIFSYLYKCTCPEKIITLISLLPDTNNARILNEYWIYSILSNGKKVKVFFYMFCCFRIQELALKLNNIECALQNVFKIELLLKKYTLKYLQVLKCYSKCKLLCFKNVCKKVKG